MQLPSNYFSFQKVSLRLPCFNLYWGTSPVLFPPVDCTCFPASHCFLIIFTFVVSDDLAAFPYSALWSIVLCDTCTHSYLVHYHKPGESSCFIPVSVFNLLHPGRRCRPPAIHHLGGPGVFKLGTLQRRLWQHLYQTHFALCLDTITAAGFKLWGSVVSTAASQ